MKTKTQKRKEAIKRMEKYIYWVSKACRYVLSLNGAYIDGKWVGYNPIKFKHEPSTKKNWDKRRLNEINYLNKYELKQ